MLVIGWQTRGTMLTKDEYLKGVDFDKILIGITLVINGETFVKGVEIKEIHEDYSFKEYIDSAFNETYVALEHKMLQESDYTKDYRKEFTKDYIE